MNTLFAFILFALSLNAQDLKVDTSMRMDFEAYDPPSTLVVPEHQVTRAKFPFIDVHSHHWRMADQDLSVLIGQMDSLNMGIVVNLSGRGGAALKAMSDNIKKYGYQGRIALFTNIEIRSIGDPDWLENTIKQLEYDVQNGAVGLKIYKSQGMDHKDSSGQRITIDDPRLDPVWEKCGQLGIPVLIHSGDPKQFWEPFDANNERWLELKTHPAASAATTTPRPGSKYWPNNTTSSKTPRTTFINAHMGWFPNDLQHLGSILDDMPNVYVEIGAVIAELGRQPRAARQFFEKYQDRVLFGKDAYHPEEYPTYFRVLETADEYFPYYKRYHAFWRMYGLELPDNILKKLYYKNALKIIPGLDKSQFPR
ncbi:MAG: amidohydrolase family protein [Saprospiraceae bacterium]|nr:amidohydrolase family protein [Saprospiraceae bacterium]